MSMPPINSPVGSFEVRCRVGQFVMDSDDPDRAPDLIAVGGTVKIEPDVRRPIRVTGPDGPRVVGVDALEFTIDTATGKLVHPDGQPGVELIDPTDEHLDPQGWTYTANVRPEQGRPWSVTFGAPTDGGIVDLGGIVPVAPSPGVTENHVQQAIAARDQAESFAVRAETAATDAEDWAPSFDWDGTRLVIDGDTGPDLQGPAVGGIGDVPGLRDALPVVDTTVGTRMFLGGVMIHGETEKRDVTALFQSGLSSDNVGKVLMFRSGTRVIIEFDAVTLLPGTGTIAWSGVLGYGWRPLQGSSFATVTRRNNITRVQSIVALVADMYWGAELSHGSGPVTSSSTRPDTGLRGQIEYEANGWPTSLPGEPA